MAHERRVRFAARFPIHATLRVKDDVPSLRCHGALRIVQQAVREAGHHSYFRVVHEARRGERLNRDWIDPFSSACWFDGWRDPVRLREPRQRELLNLPQPTAAPTVWLLTTGWRKRWGPLSFDEVGGARTR